MNTKKSIFALILSALVLTGCSIKDGFNAARYWVGKEVYFPVADWIEEPAKEAEEEKKEETPVDPEGGEGGEVTPVEPKVFSMDDVETFFASFELEVEVPDYKSNIETVTYEADESYTDLGLYYVSATNSTHEEMEAYKDELAEAGWVMEADEVNDYTGFYHGSSDVTVYLMDYTNPDDLEEGEEPFIYIVFVAETNDGKEHIVLNSSDGVYEKDDGVIHQVMASGYRIDLVGYGEFGGSFGTIQKDTYGSYVYNGMIYNRSLIDNLSSIKVNYTGEKLYYKFTEFLMEDMNFDNAHELESGKKYSIPEGHPYFVLYTLGNEASYINKIDIGRNPEGNEDYKMIFDKSYESTMGGARSNAKSWLLENDLIELENNPTKSTNNYSVGTTSGHSNKDTWYRWNGRYFTKSENLGTDFTFSLTIIGDYSRMIDESKFFHYNVWPQFAYENCFTTEGGLENKSNTYAQVYIGNDNYEPLGAENALHPSDVYTQQAYEGRFFTDYGFVSAGYWNIWINNLNKDLKEGTEVKHFESEQAAKDYISEHSLDPVNYEPYEDGEYKFLDPDTSYIEDGETTFRQAYEAYNLPFWKVDFHVYLPEGEDAQPVCESSINGFKLFTYDIFEHYDMENSKDIYIYTMPMHLANYGIDAEGNVDETCFYKGTFTYPRIVD